MILFYAFFAPPLNGVSSITMALYDLLGNRNVKLDFCPLNSNELGVKRRRFGRIYQTFKVLKHIVRNISDAKSIYITPSGGIGLIIDSSILVFILMMSNRPKLFVHHHSYGYIGNKSFYYSIFCFFAKKFDVANIFLSEKMEEDHSLLYGVSPSLSLSNAAFMNFERKPEKLKGHIGEFVIGLLCNLEESKGVLEFLELVEYTTKTKNKNFKFVLAGPFIDQKLKPVVDGLQESNEFFEYLGPVYGAEKDAFFESLDLFYYPTKKDAEPLVIYEAMSQSIPVLSTNVGCIKDMLPMSHDYFIEDKVFNPAVELIKLERIRSSYAKFASEIYETWVKKQSEAKLNLKSLLMVLGDGL